MLERFVGELEIWCVIGGWDIGNVLLFLECLLENFVEEVWNFVLVEVCWIGNMVCVVFLFFEFVFSVVFCWNDSIWLVFDMDVIIDICGMILVFVEIVEMIDVE